MNINIVDIVKILLLLLIIIIILTPWPESASELYRQIDSHLSAKLVPSFADRGCREVSAADPYGRILYYKLKIKSSSCLWFPDVKQEECMQQFFHRHLIMQDRRQQEELVTEERYPQRRFA
jgi:hypothetical protein